MLLHRAARPICRTCRYQLLSLFTHGFSSASSSSYRSGSKSKQDQTQRVRALHLTASLLQAPRSAMVNTLSGRHDITVVISPAEMELLVRRVKQTFGETLPPGFLSPEEYSMYERFYGPPLRETRAEDVSLLQSVEDEISLEGEIPEESTSLQDNDEGLVGETGSKEDINAETEEKPSPAVSWEASKSAKEFKARVRLFQDIAAAMEPVIGMTQQKLVDETEAELDDSGVVQIYQNSGAAADYPVRLEEVGDIYEEDETLRAHPLTVAGRFSTSPSTLQLPREMLVDPVTSMLATHSIKHLADGANRIFGGPGLPNSTATPSSKRHLQQAPVALEASQSKMTELEGNLFLAAVMPGAYAAIMGTLVETRKRLGSEWLGDLMKKDGGPRIMDTGSGGAGVIAWREVLRAEWERLHPNGLEDGQTIPFGKATVVTGSAELRHRVSQLLENTTFLPRLPDYLAARDLPVDRDPAQTQRKQYDIIVAPHTLWSLKEDHMRKAQVQNLWSLLSPNGGVLIIIEKGVPRGFELVAGARETLLNNHIASVGFTETENEIQDPLKARFIPKEEGMIIAPCTNHAQCPMYTVPGQRKGRKDYCHFSQRYIRPQYLQRILGASERNHEDIRYSYIALRRGVDSRKIDNIQQGSAATDAAFAGFGGDHEEAVEDSPDQPQREDDSIQPHMLSLPRMIMPPLKRTGHVTLDFCTPSGKLERWTVPRSFNRQAYRDARKSQWGDLWALGAKTRVPRTAKAGEGKDGNKPVRVYEVGIGATDDEDRTREVLPKGRYAKRTKKGRVERRPRKISEDEI